MNQNMHTFLISALILGFANMGNPPKSTDWLASNDFPKPQLIHDKENNCITFTNGIVARSWYIREGAMGCTSLKTKATSEELIRAVRPEAILKINGKEVSVGGLANQPDQAFLDTTWLKEMTPNPGFHLIKYELHPGTKIIEWKTLADRRIKGKSSPNLNPKDVNSRIAFSFEGVESYAGISVSVVYEVYSGLPVFNKQITVTNNTGKSIRLDEVIAETLAVVEPESGVDHQDQWKAPNISVTTDYTFAGMSLSASNKSVRWKADPTYTTQVNYELKTPCLLEVGYPVGPSVDLEPKQSFTSFRVTELLHDSTDRERRSLELRQTYRRLAPWVLENPIMLHLTSSDPVVVRRAIDQASECGFEMIVISFWSGLDMEDISESNIAKWKELVDYAHSKKLFLGGYSLLASRSIDKDNDVIDPKTGKPGGAIFGTSPCLCSNWGTDYFRKLKLFIEKTGFDLLEHDGSYPGDVCASTNHPGHRGLEDSQWKQYQVISEFYRWCRAQGIYLNVPDNYHLAGSNKTGMGYRESNWSLPRALQHIHARQNLFDGTWEKTPSMGWMMVPLVEYQGGGKEATIEPLKEHLADYQKHLMNNFGYGAQACYRGPRLFDSPETKAMVIESVNWFKKYRKILESDVIHLRRPTGRDIDAILHVNHLNKDCGMLLVWNPTERERTEELQVPTSYLGAGSSLSIGKSGVGFVRKDVKDKVVKIKVKISAQSMSWYVIRK